MEYHLTSAKQFENLLNESSNYSQYRHGVHFTYGSISTVEREDGRNTRLQLLNTKPRHPPVIVFYKRGNPNIITNLVTQAGFYPSPMSQSFTTHDVVDLLREAEIINLEAYEYVSEDYEPTDTTINITLTGLSPVWLPGTFTVELISAQMRIIEDGDVRLTEDGQVRLMEAA